MKFIKKNSKYIGIVMICVFCSYLTTIATNYIFDSGDVRFDNTGTSLESVNVQDAIDETFHHVTDYNEIKTTIGNSTLTTTDQTLTGGINEVNGNIGNLTDLVTADKTSLVAGVNAAYNRFITIFANGLDLIGNFNDATTPGTGWTFNNTSQNRPSSYGDYGQLFVLGGSYVIQIAVTTAPAFCYRVRVNGTWASWKQL